MAYPYADTMPTPAKGAEHIFAPDPNAPTLCYWCNSAAAAHKSL